MKPQKSRVLGCIPILHAGVDMGQLEGILSDGAAKALGEEAWRRHQAQVTAMWDIIEHTVLSLPLDFSKLMVYQDGLPICDREADIVAELAAVGSRNYLLLQRLCERGALLQGTESPELLIEEHELARQLLAPAHAGENEARQALAAQLLQRRDRFIAARINSTLPPSSYALLFIGALHDVARWIPDDIEILYPIGRPRPEASA